MSGQHGFYWTGWQQIAQGTNPVPQFTFAPQSYEPSDVWLRLLYISVYACLWYCVYCMFVFALLLINLFGITALQKQPDSGSLACTTQYWYTHHQKKLHSEGIIPQEWTLMGRLRFKFNAWLHLMTAPARLYRVAMLMSIPFWLMVLCWWYPLQLKYASE